MIGDQSCRATVTRQRTIAPWALWLALVVPSCGHPDETLQLMQRAQDSISLIGERHYTSKVGSRYQQSAERVILAAGRFRIELLAIDGKRPEQMDESGRARFEQLARRYEGSLGRRVRL